MTMVSRPSYSLVSFRDPSIREQDAYQDKDPSPPRVVAYAAHMANAPSKDTTESASQGSAAEEQRNAVLSLLSLVPHTQVVNYTWEQARFCHTEAVMVSS
jgi:hypothetical protein